jgi:hypothetical protein
MDGVPEPVGVGVKDRCEAVVCVGRSLVSDRRGRRVRRPGNPGSVITMGPAA